VPNPKQYARAAAQNLKQKLGAHCLEEAMEFVHGFQGFNWFTRPLWRWVMKVNVA
jgi:hypothetical protein